MKTVMVGVGTRTLNFLIDTPVIALLAYAPYKVNNWYVFYYKTPFYSYIYFFALVLLLYYTISEGTSGRTMGKYVSFSRVVTQKGNKPSWAVCFVRSLLRLTLIDLFFIPFFDRPLHDVLTKTYVVES